MFTLLKNNVKIVFYNNDFANILEIIKALKDKNITFVLNNLENFVEFRNNFKEVIASENIVIDRKISFEKYLYGEEIWNHILLKFSSILLHSGIFSLLLLRL